MALNYTYLKYKDVYTIRNNGTVTLSYGIDTVTCEATTENKAGTILAGETITLNFAVDGTYSVRIFTTLESAPLISIKYYNNLLTSFISLVDQIICNCNNCKECEECDECEDLLKAYIKSQAFATVNHPLYQTYITEVTQDSICLYTQEILCTLLNEKIYGNSNTKKLLSQLLSFYFLAFYYKDLSLASNAEEGKYITTKYKFDRIATCMRAIGVIPVNPIT